MADAGGEGQEKGKNGNGAGDSAPLWKSKPEPELEAFSLRNLARLVLLALALHAFWIARSFLDGRPFEQQLLGYLGCLLAAILAATIVTREGSS